MRPEEFAQKIKTKYPQYQNVDDLELATKIVAKYPQYADTVQFQKDLPDERSIFEKAEDVGSKITNFLGGQKVAETFGAEIAKAKATPEEKALIEQPGVKETAGSALALGSLFSPVGRITGLVSKGLGKLGLTKGAETISRTVAGGVTGASADIGFNLSEGEQAELGAGTIIGAGLPIASPVAKALGKAALKLTAKGGAEVQGALTGTSAETIEQAFNAAKKGGKDLEQFTSALRGQTTPEKLVNSVRQNISTISSQRQSLYKETLNELSDMTVNTNPAKTGLLNKLQEAGITVGDNGLLDFSKSKLKLVPAAQSKIQTAWQEVASLSDNTSIGDIDTTRQALKALSQSGDDPSANLANKLIDDAVREVRGVGEQVSGYGQMLDNFGETSQFLDELEKGLASGEKKTVDQAYRRMATALKTNNEQRMALINELDEATDGAVLSTISGQQLSETLPRGIFRQIAAGLAGVGIVSGGLTTQAIPALVFASPRVTGEFVRALGLGTAKTNQIINAIGNARDVLLKAGIITGASVENSGDLEE